MLCSRWAGGAGAQLPPDLGGHCHALDALARVGQAYRLVYD
ncbi:hypothetical protein [Nocardia cyriacigeorgica]|nr:hypothetical protein [Nocardia cyriacigeorgica]